MTDAGKDLVINLCNYPLTAEEYPGNCMQNSTFPNMMRPVPERSVSGMTADADSFGMATGAGGQGRGFDAVMRSPVAGSFDKPAQEAMAESGAGPDSPLQAGLTEPAVAPVFPGSDLQQWNMASALPSGAVTGETETVANAWDEVLPDGMAPGAGGPGRGIDAMMRSPVAGSFDKPAQEAMAESGAAPDSPLQAGLTEPAVAPVFPGSDLQQWNMASALPSGAMTSETETVANAWDEVLPDGMAPGAGGQGRGIDAMMRSPVAGSFDKPAQVGRVNSGAGPGSPFQTGLTEPSVASFGSGAVTAVVPVISESDPQQWNMASALPSGAMTSETEAMINAGGVVMPDDGDSPSSRAVGAADARSALFLPAKASGLPEAAPRQVTETSVAGHVAQQIMDQGGDVSGERTQAAAPGPIPAKISGVLMGGDAKTGPTSGVENDATREGRQAGPGPLKPEPSPDMVPGAGRAQSETPAVPARLSGSPRSDAPTVSGLLGAASADSAAPQIRPGRDHVAGTEPAKTEQGFLQAKTGTNFAAPVRSAPAETMQQPGGMGAGLPAPAPRTIPVEQGPGQQAVPQAPTRLDSHPPGNASERPLQAAPPSLQAGAAAGRAGEIFNNSAQPIAPIQGNSSATAAPKPGEPLPGLPLNGVSSAAPGAMPPGEAAETGMQDRPAPRPTDGRTNVVPAFGAANASPGFPPPNVPGAGMAQPETRPSPASAGAIGARMVSEPPAPSPASVGQEMLLRPAGTMPASEPVKELVPEVSALSPTMAPDRTTQSTPSALLPGPGANQPLAQQIAQQIAAGAQDRQGGPVTLTLNPEELGRVHLVFRGENGNLAVSLTVERPETLDLMRRHIETLTQELRNSGYREVNIGFGQEGTRQGAFASEDGRPNSPEPARPEAEAALSSTEAASTPGPLSPMVSDAGVDIRL